MKPVTPSFKRTSDLLTAPVYGRWPVLFVRGKGSLIYDEHGNEILDFVGGIATCLVGHGRREVAQAVKHSASNLINATNLYYTKPQIDLAKILKRISGLDRVFFSNSGTEAVEAAIKFARRSTGRRNFVAFTGAFHGRSMGALSATHKQSIRDPFKPLLPGFKHVPFGDLERTAKAVGADTAGIIVEPIQGETGIVPAPPGFLGGLAGICRKSGALLIADEIQSGMGRTGKWFAYQHEGVRPDMVVLAKGLANGVPIGATLMTEEVAAGIKPGDHGSTFGGNDLATSAALATLNVVRSEKLVGRAAKLGRRLAKGLGEIDHPRVTGVRGLGLMQALVFKDDPTDVGKRALQNGLLVLPTSQSVLRMLPALTVTEKQIDRAVAILKESLQ